MSINIQFVCEQNVELKDSIRNNISIDTSVLGFYLNNIISLN